ncbi:MAG: PAS domain-containing protein, partial [Bacteroidota bacterium]|nr:PAS domain-containing protein [Bacteroidota bacterium]
STKEEELLKRFASLVMNEIELRHTALLQYEFEKALMQSKERFELVAKATQDAIWDWDLKTSRLWWNEGFKSLFGYKTEEIEGDISSWYDRVHPDDRERVINGIHGVIDNGSKHWSAEYRFRKKDGGYAIVFDRGYALHDQAGKAYRMLGSMQDITERKKYEDAAKENEARTRLAVESAHMGTYEINIDEQTILHSPRAAEIFGLDPSKQWPYQAFLATLHPDDGALREKAHETAVQTGDLFYECRILLPDRSIRWIRLNGTLLKQGETTYLIGTALDITEEKEAASLLEKKIHERTTELNAANEQLKQFAYAASHDLQEPLRKISFFVDRLIANNAALASEENKRLSDRIQHTIVRMRKLIDDLLEYSNTTLRAAAFVEVNLNDTVRDVLDDMEAVIIQSNATIEVDALPIVKGDPRQLKQLLQNLISNAVKYHKKGDAPSVWIRSRQVDGEALTGHPENGSGGDAYHEIEVKDNGIGFDPADAKRIFSLFQRLHGKAEYEGTGIGLSIVQKVVENHNGCIRAEGEPGKGSSFKVLLPVTQ